MGLAHKHNAEEGKRSTNRNMWYGFYYIAPYKLHCLWNCTLQHSKQGDLRSWLDFPDFIINCFNHQVSHLWVEGCQSDLARFLLLTPAPGRKKTKYVKNLNPGVGSEEQILRIVCVCVCVCACACVSTGIEPDSLHKFVDILLTQLWFLVMLYYWFKDLNCIFVSNLRWTLGSTSLSRAL